MDAEYAYDIDFLLYQFEKKWVKIHRISSNMPQIASSVKSQDPKLATFWLIFFMRT